jgi:hypothetical protein
MGTIPRPRIVSRSTDLEADDLPEQVTISVRELAGAVKQGLLALSVGVGLAVVHELFEAEVTRLAGPKGKHDPDRRAYRHGQESRQVTLGGRRVQVDKPRVRVWTMRKSSSVRSGPSPDGTCSTPPLCSGCWSGSQRAITRPAWSRSVTPSNWLLRSQPYRGVSYRAPSRSWLRCSDATSVNSTCWPSSSMGC